jgi:antitoxin VapB
MIFHMILNKPKRAALFRNGKSQAVRIPKAMEIAASEVLIYQEGNRLVLDPVFPKSRLLDVLKDLQPAGVDFPDVDATLPGLEDPEF